MEIEWVIAKDNAQLYALLAPPLIALDSNGEELDSTGASKKIIRLFAEQGSKLHFVIGGAEGLSQQWVAKSAWTWSLSKLTFTHQMTRLVLLEQLYRAVQIDLGTAYHK